MAKSKSGLELIIVESPSKAKTIKQYFPDKIVKASVGHIAKIKDSGLYNMGIDVKGNFNIDFVVDDSKKDVVKELKKDVERADVVYLGADPDREGEAIAYHLKNFLNIPDKKLKRITYHEVTKKAIEDAMNKPRKIDNNLVNAALSRASLDKIIGYRLSPIARNKVSCRSVGRCQSPALRLLVDREEEIINFIPDDFYEIWLPFTKDKVEYKAQYKGLIKDDKNTPTIKDKELAEKIVNDCKGYDYTIHKIESKDRNVASKDPFITSTYQQEVSSKLGYSVKTASMIAQKLFEGINIAGQHIPLTSYLRTDDISMDPEFKDKLKQFIVDTYGKEYLKEEEEVKEKKSKKKKETNVQGGHECFRVLDLHMTPEKLSTFIQDQQMLKVYELIYNRTVASMMSDAVITDVNFIIKNGEYKFIYSEHAEKFPGFRSVYKFDDEEIKTGLDVYVGEKLETKELDLQHKQTTPPARYTESKLVKKLEDSGVGRPSTFASIINTLLDPGRGYCEEQGKSLVPTEKGIRLIHFLKEAFPDAVDLDYTSRMEENLDKMARGELDRVDYLKDVYNKLEDDIKKSKSVQGEKSVAEAVEGRTCPQCGKQLVIRNGRFGRFISCTGFPRCKFTEKIV